MKPMSRIFFLISVLAWANMSQALSDDAAPAGKGVGPVKELKLEAISPVVSAAGKTTFTAKCSACHKMEERYVGPALKGVTKRRAPEWIMNMILNPKDMLEQDETAKELLGEFLTQMTFQNVTQDETRGILEYFREYDEKGASAGGTAEKKEEKHDKKTEKKNDKKHK